MNFKIKEKTKLPAFAAPLLLILLGAFLRLFYLGAVPGGIHQDESFSLLNALGLFHEGTDTAGKVLPIYLSDWGDGQSALYSWLLLPILLLSGGRVPSLFWVRFPQAAVSIATLFCVYCLVKRMFNRNAGLWALFALAICPWHIMMSRWGLDANLAPGFLIFSLYFFVRGLENKRFLLLSAFFYGLALYCYAVVWSIVPIILLLQIGYGLYHKKLSINKYSLLSALLLFIMALPLLLYVMVNSGLLPEITLPFMTIPLAPGYRGSEIALNPLEMLENLKTALRLLVFQNTGSPYDVLLPWGLFYDLGRLFIVIGAVCLLVRVIRSFLKKEFVWEFFLFVQLLAGGIVCLLVSARLHQVNALFIPLVLCEGYGLFCTVHLLERKKIFLSRCFTALAAFSYLVCLLLFQRDYYTDYRKTADAYFGRGIKECIEYALAQCEETGISTITAEKGLQWPRLLLYTNTLPSEYLQSVTYDPEYITPAPAAYDSHGLHINTRIHYDCINQESIYILYFTDVPTFEKDFQLTQFYDWYVAVPKNPVEDYDASS